MIRYDLLCMEGLVRALQVFLGKRTPPLYTTIKHEKVEQVFVKSEVISLLNPKKKMKNEKWKKKKKKRQLKFAHILSQQFLEMLHLLKIVIKVLSTFKKNSTKISVGKNFFE